MFQLNVSKTKETRNLVLSCKNLPTEDPGLIQITFLNHADVP